jgi:hypothetical protein
VDFTIRRKSDERIRVSTCTMVGSSINVGRILAQLAAAAVCVYGGVGRQDVEDIQVTDNVLTTQR